MRAQHLTAAEIQAYAAHQLKEEHVLEISDHVVGCAECRALLRQAEQFRATPVLGNVSYEELADFIDHNLDPVSRREVEQKLAVSPRARAELADLAQFKREAAASISKQPPQATWLRRWSLPLAASLAAGLAFLWWSVASQPRAGALVLRDNGARIEIMPDGSLIGGPSLPSELRDSLRSALSQNRLAVPAEVARLRGEKSVLAGAATKESTLRVVAPVGTAVAQSSPEFRWNRDNRATAYRITIAKPSDAQPIANADLPKEQLSWRPPAPLTRGDEYIWQVQALQNGEVIATAPAPPEPEARFRILSDEQEQELEASKQRLGNSHLALALAYARAGLVDEADAQLAVLEQENRDSRLPAQLRSALRNGVASR